MTSEQFQELPIAQREALYRLQERSGIDWDDFLSRCLAPTPIQDYVAVLNFNGMYVGVEADGYTHS